MNLHHHVEESKCANDSRKPSPEGIKSQFNANNLKDRQAGYSPYATGAQSKNTAGGVPAGYNTFAQVAQQTANVRCTCHYDCDVI